MSLGTPSASTRSRREIRRSSGPLSSSRYLHVSADPSPQFAQPLPQWCGRHVSQVERRIEQVEQLVLEAVESVAVVVRVDGDREVPGCARASARCARLSRAACR